MNFKAGGFSFDSVFKNISKVTDNIVKAAAKESGSFCHVTNPKLPYVGALPNKACPGTCITVRGVTRLNGDFSINLQCGSADTEDIAFHFNVRGSQRAGVVDEAEDAYCSRTPGLVLLYFYEVLHVKLDQSSFCDFIHRVELEKITTLAITGEVDISYVGFHHTPTFDGSDSDLDVELHDSNFMKTETLISGEMSCHQLPKGGYPQSVDSQQQSLGGFHQPAASHPQPAGAYPQSTGSHTQPAGAYPQSTGSHPQPAGAYPQSTGSHQQPAGAYPQSTGSHPQPAGAYPQSTGSHQQPAGAYPQSGGSHPQPTGGYTQVPYPADTYSQPTGNPQQFTGGYPQAPGNQPYSAGAYPQPTVNSQHPTSCYPQSVGSQQNGNQPLPNPLTMPIPGEMTAGRMVTVSGTPRTGCKSFTINLRCDKTAIKDIALHIDVRMQRPGHSQQVVRNSCIRGRWGNEEKHGPYFPFQPNASFDIMILCEQDMFKLAVNNQHFTEFNHRMQQLNRINVVNVSGDVQLTKISFQ